MKNDWLWDRNISIRQAVRILNNPKHPRFISISGLLLSRKNSPQEVFRNYIKAEEFCRYWLAIKRQMRRDDWNNPRIEFWQAVYEKLLEKFHAKGISISLRNKVNTSSGFCIETGRKLKALRKQQKLTQAMLSKKLNVSQQMISRIESGRENISLLTLKKFAQELGAQACVNFIK